MAVAKQCRLGGLNNRHLFLKILEAKIPRSWCPRFGFWCDSSWLAEGYLLISASPGLSLVQALGRSQGRSL